MNKPRILFIYPVLTLGGVETVIFTRMRGLGSIGAEVQAVFRRGYSGTNLPADLTGKIRVTDSQEEFCQVLDDFRPDWVLHFDSPDYLRVVHAAMPSARQVYEVHTTLVKNLECLRNPANLEFVSGLVVPSQYQASLVRNYLRSEKPIEVVPNSVSDGFLSPAERNSTRKKRIVAWVGRFESQKNWIGYLDIAMRIGKEIDDVEFWMIGGQRSTLEQQQTLWQTIQKAGLTQRFRWFPVIPSTQMPAALKTVGSSGGCFVSTSRGESFGLAVLEAMAARCPVVAPAVGGLAEIVADQENGLIYPMDNIEQATGCVKQILHNQKLQARMAENAWQTASHYSSKETIQKLLTVLDRFSRQSLPA
ncbi:MAG TPA: glycosyltransferase family 4 protein [Anaerolineaceae bacterium]|nr:glycosyltransferase family 4 protein [Anaerolineaceae bacterium]